MDEETPKPTIDPDSPTTTRRNSIVKDVVKQDTKEYQKTYYTMKKFRRQQMELLHCENIEDPYPFESTYVFFCFTGRLNY